MSPLAPLRNHPYRTSNVLQGLVAFLALFCGISDSIAMAIEGPYLYIGRIPCEFVIFFIYSASLLQNAWTAFGERRLYHAQKRRCLRLGWSLPVVLALVFVWIAELYGTAVAVSRWNNDQQEREATAPGFEDYRANMWHCLPAEHHCVPRNMAWCGIVALVIAFVADGTFHWRRKWPQDEAEYWEWFPHDRRLGAGGVAGYSAGGTGTGTGTTAGGTLPPMGLGIIDNGSGSDGQDGEGKDRHYYRLEDVKSTTA
ncbi:hypothetical protein BGW42_003192 [Actinomortierella wolfii]|nr:hypothetical protein BGW42_003192 [Actinomortierella wolfii]